MHIFLLLQRECSYNDRPIRLEYVPQCEKNTRGNHSSNNLVVQRLFASNLLHQRVQTRNIACDHSHSRLHPSQGEPLQSQIRSNFTCLRNHRRCRIHRISNVITFTHQMLHPRIGLFSTAIRSSSFHELGSFLLAHVRLSCLFEISRQVKEDFPIPLYK